MGCCAEISVAVQCCYGAIRVCHVVHFIGIRFVCSDFKQHYILVTPPNGDVSSAEQVRGFYVKMRRVRSVRNTSKHYNRNIYLVYIIIKKVSIINS